MAANKFRSARERDPLAELARLIAQANTHDESAPPDNRSREETVSDGHGEAPELPPAPQLTVDPNDEQDCSGVQAHDVDDQLYAAEEGYQDSEVPHNAGEEGYQDSEVPLERRHSLTLVIAIFGLALVGTASAVGYRNTFGGSVSSTLPPSKAINERNTIAPASEPQAASSRNAREVGPVTTGSIDNMVARKQPPTTVGSSKVVTRASLPQANAPEMPPAGQAVPKQAMPLVAVATDPSGPPPSPPVLGSGYAVQVTSQRSESRAQAAFRGLQAKYPDQLSGRQPIIHRADLGAAGIYYRALVGPFASAEKAAKLCSGLKAAGGDCIVLKN
jgi:hypothetical protein